MSCENYFISVSGTVSRKDLSKGWFLLKIFFRRIRLASKRSPDLCFFLFRHAVARWSSNWTLKYCRSGIWESSLLFKRVEWIVSWGRLLGRISITSFSYCLTNSDITNGATSVISMNFQFTNEPQKSLIFELLYLLSYGRWSALTKLRTNTIEVCKNAYQRSSHQEQVLSIVRSRS